MSSTNQDICESSNICGLSSQLLRTLKRKVRRWAGRRLTPASVVCDFEVSLHNAIEAELNGADIKGCYFHLVQSFTRYVTFISPQLL